MKHESLNLGPKLPYLDIFKVALEKNMLSHLKQNRIFHKVLCKIENPQI